MISEGFHLSAPTIDKARFVSEAAHCGFELAGVAPAAELEDHLIYSQWVTDGMAGPMGYLADHRAAIRRDPRQLLPGAKSVLCLGKLYKTLDISWRQAGGKGFVSRYAWGAADYHEVLRAGLERLVERLTALTGPFVSRICVDTAPLLERSLARQAGLGWIGKNTCLINQSQGSWFFLGFVLTDLEVQAGTPPPDRCGTCRRCIDACPTEAILQNEPGQPGPWRVDGRLCLSTLTIETKGAAPESTRAATGPHLFGCDICQEVCPWNRRSPMTSEPAFQPVNALLDLGAMAEMTPSEFRERFLRTPIWRAKYAGWLRNVATVMGNSGDPKHKEALLRLAAHEDEGVAEHALWALERLGAAE